jgi:hypothetical protein
MYLHVFDVQGKICNLQRCVHVFPTLPVERIADTKTVGVISDSGIRLADVVVGQGFHTCLFSILVVLMLRFIYPF